MVLLVMPFDLLQQKKQYRAPFKVHFAQWNPCSNLLALASHKGEVMVKRNAWKRCWKLNVSELTAFAETQCSKPACVESITWSPDGGVLAVAMNDGHLHLIEAEQGFVRWSRKLGQTSFAVRMRWFWVSEKSKVKSETCKYWKVKDEVKAVASILGNGEDVVDDRLKRALLKENLYLKSLKDTLLFMIRNDLVVLVLAGGLLPISEIRLTEKLAYLKLDIVNIYDVMYAEKSGLTLAVTNYGPRPKFDELDRDPICTRSSSRLSGENSAGNAKSEGVRAEKKFGFPSFSPDAITCPHTHLINVDFKLENEDLIWEILLRYLNMFTCLMHLTYSMELAQKDWESESKIFSNRLNSSTRDFKLGDSLLNILLGGAAGPLAERWFERCLGATGIHSMREFVDKRFSGLISMLRGQLSAAARALAFQMDQYSELIKELRDQNTNYESVTLPVSMKTSGVLEPESTSSSQIPDMAADYVFDALDPNEFKAIVQRLHEDGIKIQVKCQEFSLAAVNNLRELSQLVHWMSSLTPLLKNAKKSQVMDHSRGWDVANLLEYIVQTFVTEVDERERLRNCLFNIEEILKEVQLEESKENLDETELMSCSSEGNLTTRDDRSLGELLSAGRRDASAMTPSLCGASDASTSQTFNHRHHEFVLDKVNGFWSDKLDESTLQFLRDRFALGGVKEVIRSTEKSLSIVVKEVTGVIQAASLLLIQCDTNMSIKWMYELASAASHCGFDSVQLSPFRWSDTRHFDVYENKLYESKGQDIEGAICVTTICREAVSCEYLLPHVVGKLKAGVQADMSVSITMEPGGFAETTPVQNEETQNMDWQSEFPLQLVTDENAVFGNIVKFIFVETYTSGNVYLLATFKCETGEVTRLMRKHPNLEAWLVHNGLVSEACQLALLSSEHQEGCIISEEGSRVTLFRLQNSFMNEHGALLMSAPVHRPALQMLPA